MPILFLFIDGLGLRADPHRNPVNPAICPHLHHLIQNHSQPIDACLGTPGLPQSATGQASLFTGINVPQALGRHVPGFPGPHIRSLLKPNHIFRQLIKRGHSCKFANGYYGRVEEIAARRWRSVTTVMALDTPQTICGPADILANRALSEDITRAALAQRGYTGPIIPPELAAEHLFDLSQKHAFTLYEYFRTDFAGHTGDLTAAHAVLSLYDRFLGRLLQLIEHHPILLVITSDHGNVEDMTVTVHTRNPVPLITLGPDALPFRSDLRAITDVTPRIVEVITANAAPTMRPHKRAGSGQSGSLS